MEIAKSFREFPASSFLFGQSLPSECLLLLTISSFHVCTWSRLGRLILLQQSQIPEQQWRLDSKPQSISSGQCCTGKARRCSGIGLCRLRYVPWQRRRRHFLRLPPHPAPTLRLLASTCFSFPLAQVTGWSLLRTLGPFVPRGFSHFPQLGGLSVSDLSCEVLERGFEEARESLGFPFFLLLILLPRAFAFSADCRFFECLCSLVAQEQG